MPERFGLTIEKGVAVEKLNHQKMAEKTLFNSHRRLHSLRIGRDDFFS
jgi:hypothetical protein